MRVGQMNEYPLTSIVTLALVVLWWVLGSRVSLARATYANKQQNPEMFHSLEIYSDAGFMIAFRNHQNLSEFLVVMWPTLWICAIGVSDLVAASLGFTILVGRIWWAGNYSQSISHRSAVSLCLFSFIALMLSAIGGMIYTLIQQF